MEFRTIHSVLLVLLGLMPSMLVAQTPATEDMYYTELIGPEVEEEPKKAAPFFLPRSEEENKDKYGPVLKTDTLWSIANRFRPDPTVSIYQTMQAIWEANPRAFVDQDYKMLKQGAYLMIPDTEMIASVSEETARLF